MHERYHYDPERYHYDRFPYDRYDDRELERHYSAAPLKRPGPPGQKEKRESWASAATGGGVAEGRSGMGEQEDASKNAKAEVKDIWQGTTWDVFPFLLMCCAPVRAAAQFYIVYPCLPRACPDA